MHFVKKIKVYKKLKIKTNCLSFKKNTKAVWRKYQTTVFGSK